MMRQSGKTPFQMRGSGCVTKDVGKVFTAMVTGASPKGTWVRLEDPPVEGKLTKGFEGVDVGDYLKVKLIRVDMHHGAHRLCNSKR